MTTAPARLRDRIAADYRPVRALRSPGRGYFAIVPLAIVALVAAPLAFNVRADVPALGWFGTWGLSLLQCVVGVLVVGAALRESIPGRDWSRTAIALWMALPILAVIGITMVSNWAGSPGVAAIRVVAGGRRLLRRLRRHGAAGGRARERARGARVSGAAGRRRRADWIGRGPDGRRWLAHLLSLQRTRPRAVGTSGRGVDVDSDRRPGRVAALRSRQFFATSRAENRLAVIESPVLITGGSGYIASRLLPQLAGVVKFACCRGARPARRSPFAGSQAHAGDAAALQDAIRDARTIFISPRRPVSPSPNETRRLITMRT